MTPLLFKHSGPQIKPLFPWPWGQPGAESPAGRTHSPCLGSAPCFSRPPSGAAGQMGYVSLKALTEARKGKVNAATASKPQVTATDTSWPNQPHSQLQGQGAARSPALESGCFGTLISRLQSLQGDPGRPISLHFGIFLRRHLFVRHFAT